MSRPLTITTNRGPARDFERALVLYVNDVLVQRDRHSLHEYTGELCFDAMRAARAVDTVAGFAILNRVLVNVDKVTAVKVARGVTKELASNSDLVELLTTDLPGELSPLLFDELFAYLIPSYIDEPDIMTAQRRKRYLSDRIEASVDTLGPDASELARVLAVDWEGPLSALLTTALTLTRA
jgi:hypothetical protein